MANATMPTRPYVSPIRDTAAAEKRARVVDAASRLLREQADVASFSLDAVGKAAGVTRLTVYNQFGSRRGLLEAVFDEIARHGGLHQLPDAMAMSDPRTALVDRIANQATSQQARKDAVDLIFALTSYPTFAALSPGRSRDDVCKLLQ